VALRGLPTIPGPKGHPFICFCITLPDQRHQSTPGTTLASFITLRLPPAFSGQCWLALAGLNPLVLAIWIPSIRSEVATRGLLMGTPKAGVVPLKRKIGSP
jgi:hypothetical protein